MRLAASLLALVCISAFAQRDIAEQAELLAGQPGGYASALALLEDEVVSNPNDLAALAELCIFRIGADRGSQQPLGGDLEMLGMRLLNGRRADPTATPADMALALEIEAYIMNRVGRSEEGATLAAQALTIRKLIVESAHPSAPAPVPVERVSPGRISAPGLTEKHEPEYSNPARLARISGTVLLSIVVGPDGLPSNIALIRGIGFGLDEKAAQAVSTWRFRPGMKGEEPVSVRAQIEVNFRLL
jgi:TonB family protein